MDKKKAIAIITRAAKLYHDRLEDQKVLFIYGVPAIISKQINDNKDIITDIHYYEVVFRRTNFLHLTGVTLNKETTKSSINFYEKCLAGRLSEKDFSFAKDGSTEQKLAVLEDMMNIKKSIGYIQI